MIARRLATATATVAIVLVGGAAVPSIASASTGHTQAKPAHGVAWTGHTLGSKAGKKPTHGVAWTGVSWTGVTWTGVTWTGVTWTATKPTGTAWTSVTPAGVAWTK